MRRALLLVPALAVLAGCGSTVPLSQPGPTLQGAQAPVTSEDPGLAAPTPAAASTSSDAVSAPAVVQPGAPLANPAAPTTVPSGSTATKVPGKATTPGAVVKTTTATRTTAAASIPTTGKGWDAKTVSIGVTTEKDIQGIAQGLGYSALDPGDNEAQAKAVAADINARGGIFGRQVQISFYDVSTTAVESDVNSVESQVCTHFTQDSPVIAVINVVTVIDYDNFRTCLAKAGVPLFSASVKAVDDGIEAQLNNLFIQDVAVSWTRLAPVFAAQLKAQGYFTSWSTTTGAPATGPTAPAVKVGIDTDASPMGTRISQTIKSALAGVGITNVVTFQYAQASDGQGNTVTSFEGQGVTHVIIDDVELTAFQTSASTQGYKPRFGITTYNDPYTNLERSSPSGQNTGAIGVGWAPDFDVRQEKDPGNVGAGEAACLAVMAKAGQSYTNGRRLAEGISKSFCDGIGAIVQGAKAGGGFSGQQIVGGARSLGSTFAQSQSFASGLSASHSFIPGAVRDLAWSTSCSCFSYSGPSIPL